MKIKRDEVVPADMIILDSHEIRNREAICHVNSYMVDGKSNLIKKKACELTKSKKIYLFIYVLNIIL